MIADIELEQIVLGFFMVSLESTEVKAAYDLVMEYEGKLFTTERHLAVWAGIHAVRLDGAKPDLILVSRKLRQLGMPQSPNAHELLSFAARVGAPQNLMKYVVKLINLHERRIIYNEAVEIAKRAESDSEIDIDRGIELFTQGLKRSTVQSISIDKLSPAHRLKRTAEWVQEGKERGGITGVATGLSEFDNFIGGFQKGDLIVFGGRPGTFKTALMLHFCHYAAKNNIPALMFQQEMAEHQTGAREIAMVSGISSQKVRAAQIDYKELFDAIGKLETLPVYIDHTAGVSLGYLRQTARAMVEHKKVGLIVVDYLQLMEIKRTKGDTSEEGISRTTRALKQLAKELNVPVILLSQLRRGDGKDFKTNARPSKADLKGSGAIEADADLVCMLYREWTKENPSVAHLEDVLEIIIEKNRMGSVGDIQVYVNPATNTFANSKPINDWTPSAGLEPNTDFEEKSWPY